MEFSEEGKKLFIGGLSWETTSSSLRGYMGKYGEIMECSIKMDPTTGRSRGFGFVIFKDASSAEAVTKNGPHIIDGKTVDPKRAVAIYKTGVPITKKIFVGGIKTDIPDEKIREHFLQFGLFQSIEFPMDPNFNRRRGFCFIEFDDYEAADNAMRQNFHTIGDCTVEVKPAFTKEQQQTLQAKGLWPSSITGNAPNTSRSGGFQSGSNVQLSSEVSHQSVIAALFSLLTQSTNGSVPTGFDPYTFYQYLNSLATLYQNYINLAISIASSNENENEKK